jgi:hypothetical protein
MQLSLQRPNIQDLPAFLRAMAEVLQEMHLRNESHGSVLSVRLAEWLDDANVFQAAKFQAARASTESLPKNSDPLLHDVRCFVDLSVECIAGHTAASDQPFTAAHHKGKEWPEGFLQLLESLSKQDTPIGVTFVTLADLSSALKVPVAAKNPEPEPDPIDYTVGYSGPPMAKPATAAPAVSFALPNATVGKPYILEPGRIAKAIARQRKEVEENASITHLQLPEDCGLTFDITTGAVSGTPTSVFEGTLSLGYVSSRSAALVPITISLLINPNPASLWKDLLPPANAPYQKPLLDHSEERHGPYRIIAASRRGRSHAQKGEFRDDDYAIGYAEETGWLVIVVADGAGSATYSRRGSQIACAVAKNQLLGVLNSAQHNQAEALFLQHLDWQHPEVKKALRQSLYEAALLAHHKLRAEVAQPSEALSPPPTLRNYDTTLILLVMKKIGEGCIAATFSIGDGGAGILPHSGEGIPLTKADSGEHAGQTIFLTFDSTVANSEANLESRFHLAQTQEFAGALAMTDGITDPKFPSDAAFADPAQWAALWTELQPSLTSSQALLDWMNFFSPGNHDDRTLVAVLPAPPAAPDTP